jgi:hypothetical protein
MDDNEKLESIAKEKRQKFSVWLVENNLLDYASAFEEEGFNDLAVLAELSDAEVEELASGLRMKMGHKKKLPIAIRNLKKMKEKEQRQEQQREQEEDRRLKNRKLEEQEKAEDRRLKREKVKSRSMRGTASQEEGSSETDRQPTTANITISSRDGSIALVEDKR